MEKKAQREAMRRRKAEAKKLKKEEDEAKRAIKKGKKPKKKTQRKRYFGMPLASIIDEEEDGVPALVKDCILMVERDGMEVEGIYRVPGRKEDIIKFQEKYDRSKRADFNGIIMIEGEFQQLIICYCIILSQNYVTDFKLFWALTWDELPVLGRLVV
jgi:hypothetical protein